MYIANPQIPLNDPYHHVTYHEYIIEGFYTIGFPIGATMPKQPQIKEIEMKDYALHLLRYRDNRICRHTKVHYFLYNHMMNHHREATIDIYIKKNNVDNLPTTIAN